MTSDLTTPFASYSPRDMEVIDTTLREGQQTSLLHDHHKYFFTPSDKAEILRALIIYGVKFIELFAPLVSPKERDDFASLKSVRDSLIAQKGYTFLLAHVRCHPQDVESAIQAGADGLNFYIGTSNQSQVYNHGMDLDRIIHQARDLLCDVRRNHPHLILRFSGEDAFRTPERSLFRVYDAVVPEVDRLGLPDTVGVASPAEVEQRVNTLRSRYPGMEFEAHFHDDRGYALVNALAAIRAGVRYVNTTILGIGERSGITSLSALIYNLYLDRLYDLVEGFNLRGSYPLNVLVADKLKTLVPPKEPVSLTNRTHSAGVHQKAVLASLSSYEAHPLDLFGVNEAEILLGPLSGWNTIHYFLKEIRYFELDEATARQIAAVFKERVYELAPDASPEQVLTEIAEQDFRLMRQDLPQSTRHQIIQRLDSPQNEDLPRQPVQIPMRSNGLFVPQNGKRGE